MFSYSVSEYVYKIVEEIRVVLNCLFGADCAHITLRHSLVVDISGCVNLIHRGAAAGGSLSLALRRLLW